MLFEILASLFLLASAIALRLRGGTAAIARFGSLVWCASFAIVAYGIAPSVTTFAEGSPIVKNA